MSERLPIGTPTAAHVQARIEAAHLALEALQHQVMASLATAHGHIDRLLADDCPPGDLLAALRAIHEAARAMLEPADEIFTQLLETQHWAEGMSWDALAVPLYDTAAPPADVALWVDEVLGPFSSGAN